MQDDRARVLGLLQQELQAIYRIDTELNAADFAIEKERWQEWSGSGAPEELLVRESADGLEVGLFVDDAVVETLREPGRAWTHRRLAAHCQAVEGVSHFLYLTGRAQLERPVSQLELELQAEVDKWATLVLQLWEEGRREAVGRLRELLFVQVGYRENLPAEVRARYEKANFLASLYCRFLEAKYVVRGRIDELLADLRRMYRLGAGEKLSYVACGAAL